MCYSKIEMDGKGELSLAGWFPKTSEPLLRRGSPRQLRSDMSADETEVQTTLDIANPKHFRILTLLNLGLVPDEIAATIHCSTKLAKRIAYDPETPKHIETVKRLGRCMTEVCRTKFDELQNMSIEVFHEVLTSEKATIDQKMRAAMAVLDRHPEGEYARTAKNINKNELEIGFSNDTMKALKKIADQTNPKFIDTTAHPSPASPPGRSHQPGLPMHAGPASSFQDEPMEVACDVL